jgi:hypothetical protein
MAEGEERERKGKQDDKRKKDRQSERMTGRKKKNEEDI